MSITRNIGGLDRVLRIVAGLLLLALGAFGAIGWWGLIGLVPLATAALGHCPAYTPFGLSTCAAGRRPA